MESILEGSEHLERELTREPFAGPAAGSVGLHLAIACTLIYYAWAMGLFHHNTWGAAGAGGSIHVNLTNTLPLPADQSNQNVLATETPSKAPAAPSPPPAPRKAPASVPAPGVRCLQECFPFKITLSSKNAIHSKLLCHPERFPFKITLSS